MCAAACVAYVSDLSAAGGDVAGIDGVAFLTATGFEKEFAGGAALAWDVEVVEYCFVGIFRQSECDDHEGSSLAFEAAFDWFDPSCQGDGFWCESVGRFNFEDGLW